MKRLRHHSGISWIVLAGAVLTFGRADGPARAGEEPAARAAGRRGLTTENTGARQATPPPVQARALPETPPPPAGVTDLKFTEFFEPIGPRGLNYTGRIKSLNAKPVRLLGYMVKQEVAKSGMFLFSPVPVQLEEDEMGLADDLPACVVHVIAPTNSPSEIRFTPGLLGLIGTLSLGTREEADGRISSVRLLLDTPVSVTNKISTTAVPTTKPAP
jgi:hypothetical protein